MTDDGSDYLSGALMGAALANTVDPKELVALRARAERAESELAELRRACSAGIVLRRADVAPSDRAWPGAVACGDPTIAEPEVAGGDSVIGSVGLRRHDLDGMAPPRVRLSRCDPR